jgi:hypothetical protein
VRGPVLLPPCNRQRPFGIAGARQLAPCRVFAPQRGAAFGSPGRLPFRSRPNRRVAWGPSIVLDCTPNVRHRIKRVIDPEPGHQLMWGGYSQLLLMCEGFALRDLETTEDAE